MNPNSTWTRPDPAAENDEQFVARYLERMDMKAVDKSAVVLDLDDPADAARQLRQFDRAKGGGYCFVIRDQIADQIEAQTRPPKPPEPTGLGAVVEDADGVRWVRNPDAGVICKWRDADRRWRNYGAIDAVRVLSEGVQP